MTPLEINLKIAVLKGQAIEGVAVLFDNGPNWAEHINSAWELFEEMPGSTLNRDDETEDGRDRWHCGYRGIDGMEWAYTAPMAICLAWLKWNESKS